MSSSVTESLTSVLTRRKSSRKYGGYCVPVEGYNSANIANGKPVPESAIRNIDLWTA